MKPLLLLLTATLLLADTESQQGFERAIARYDNDACTQAKALARERYNIVDMNPGCRCERTDSHEWQCDVGFTYTSRKEH